LRDAVRLVPRAGRRAPFAAGDIRAL